MWGILLIRRRIAVEVLRGGRSALELRERERCGLGLWLETGWLDWVGMNRKGIMDGCV